MRQEKGRCCIRYSPCSDSNSFTISDASNDSPTPLSQKYIVIDNSCLTDFVEILGVQQECNRGENPSNHYRVCGQVFGINLGTTQSGTTAPPATAYLCGKTLKKSSHYLLENCTFSIHRRLHCPIRCLFQDRCCKRPGY